MRADYGFDAVGDDLAAGQAVLHAGVAHRDAIVDADGVEQERHAAGRAYSVLYDDAELIEVNMAGDDVDVAVGNGDKRLAKIFFLHACRAQQAAMRRPLHAFLDRIGAHDASRKSIVSVRSITRCHHRSSSSLK